MSDVENFVIWNGSLGVLDEVRLGRVDPLSAQAWLAEPYDMVGPFDLGLLHAEGRIAFEACLVLSKARWQSDQVELRIEGREQRRAALKSLLRDDDDVEARELLALPPEGALTAKTIQSAFRKAAKAAHPDVGGDHDDYIRLTDARDLLLKAV